MPEQPQPPSRPEPEPPPEPEYVETSADDEELDASSNAEALLSRELGAQVISVEEDNPGPT